MHPRVQTADYADFADECGSLRVHLRNLRNLWFPLRNLWFPLRNLWFPLRNLWFPLRNLWFPLRNLWFPLAICGLATNPVSAQGYSGHRITIGAGTLLLVPDSIGGLTIWATRRTRPGYRPSPDFVGWFEPDGVIEWSARAAKFLAGSADRWSPLVARDGGSLALMRQEDACCVLAFGHPSESQQWIIEGSGAEFARMLDTLVRLARMSRLDPPGDLGYANPTNRQATPDRTVGPPPAVQGDSGEIWARMTLDQRGAVIEGSTAILWATRPELGQAVLKVLPGYRYRRKDGGSRRLVVYQRFRVSGER